MDERTRMKLTAATVDYINRLIRIADEENYDRDSFIKAATDMLGVMAEISTFGHFGTDGDNDGA